MRSASTSAAWFSRASVDAFVLSRPVQTVIISVILVNAAVLGLETVPQVMAGWGDALHLLDKICLAIFVVEIAMKLYGQGWRFFTNAWNIFDFVVVGVALIPGSDGLAVLRALRVLRVLRLVSVVPALRRVVDALVKAIPGIASIALLLVIIFYVGAVMATMLFGAEFPEHFGSLGTSLFSLFQVMTLDNWSVIARSVIEVFPWAGAFFVPFVLISALTVLNLFIAVIVDAMQGLDQSDTVDEQQSAPPATTGDPDSDAAAELAALRADIAALSTLIRQQRRGEPSADTH